MPELRCWAVFVNRDGKCLHCLCDWQVQPLGIIVLRLLCRRYILISAKQHLHGLRCR